ncbi:MAG: hypothetical protein SGPRY_006233 [Prymnesium sp.]
MGSLDAAPARSSSTWCVERDHLGNGDPAGQRQKWSRHPLSGRGNDSGDAGKATEQAPLQGECGDDDGQLRPRAGGHGAGRRREGAVDWAKERPGTVDSARPCRRALATQASSPGGRAGSRRPPPGGERTH